jgi:hypothetical protein
MVSTWHTPGQARRGWGRGGGCHPPAPHALCPMPYQSRDPRTCCARGAATLTYRLVPACVRPVRPPLLVRPLSCAPAGAPGSRGPGGIASTPRMRSPTSVLQLRALPVRGCGAHSGHPSTPWIGSRLALSCARCGKRESGMRWLTALLPPCQHHTHRSDSASTSAASRRHGLPLRPAVRARGIVTTPDMRKPRTLAGLWADSICLQPSVTVAHRMVNSAVRTIFRARSITSPTR